MPAPDPWSKATQKTALCHAEHGKEAVFHSKRKISETIRESSARKRCASSRKPSRSTMSRRSRRPRFTWVRCLRQAQLGRDLPIGTAHQQLHLQDGPVDLPPPAGHRADPSVQGCSLSEWRSLIALDGSPGQICPGNPRSLPAGLAIQFQNKPGLPAGHAVN